MTGQQLKNSILQLAIQGKLVPQNPDDEPASELLQRIRKEKEKLVKEKKIKKEKPLPEISEDEKPFDIPEGWVWCRISELGITNTGTTPPKSQKEYYGNYVPFLGPGDIQNHKINYLNNGLSEQGYNVARPVTKNTILQVCIGGTIGKLAVVDRTVTFNQQINSLTVLLANHLYVSFCMESDSYKKTMKDKSTGTATPIINRSAWDMLCIPLPPLQEQHRIVEKIEELMPLVDEYDKAQKELNTLNANLPEALKKSILQEAIQGKLGTNNPDDEPASELLKRIRAEKEMLIKEKAIKKEKPLPEISEYEKPFEIPDNWVWVRFAEIAQAVTGKTPARGVGDYWLNPVYPWVSISDMTDWGHLKSTKEGISEKATSIMRRISPKGSLIMSFKLTVGRTSILDMDAYHNEAIVTIYPFIDDNNILRDYLFTILPLITKSGDTKDAIKGKTLNADSIASLLIPLPPLQEQHRIVEKLNELLPKLETLK